MHEEIYRELALRQIFCDKMDGCFVVLPVLPFDLLDLLLGDTGDANQFIFLFSFISIVIIVVIAVIGGALLLFLLLIFLRPILRHSPPFPSPFDAPFVFRSRRSSHSSSSSSNMPTVLTDRP